jgi:DNA polymerase-3 subunit alpha
LLARKSFERTEYELGVIEQMGFNGYFLIIWDFMAGARTRASSSARDAVRRPVRLFRYALKITELDPLEVRPAVRALPEPRPYFSMPDVDIDIQDTRRDEVIQYCAENTARSGWPTS